jgi:acetyl esterase
MASLSKGIEPTTRAFLESINAQKGPALYEIPVADGRAAFTRLQALNVKRLAAEVDERSIAGGPTGEVQIRIVRPKGTTRPLPVVVYLHGGGWVFGDGDIHDRLLRDLAAGAEAAFVFVEYTRSPEAKYPVALEQSYAVLEYVAKHGGALDLDVSRLVVAGDSVGGNMATALTMLAKHRNGPRIGYQVLFYPVTDARFDTGSYREFAHDHFLTIEAMKWFWDQYLPDEERRAEPTASPLRASIDQLRNLPPALIVNGEFDVLRDEGEAYAHKLIEAGVPVTAVRFHGTIHDFVMLNAISETPATRGAIALACDRLRGFFAG